MKTETLLEKIGKLFKNNLNREEIAKELGVSVEAIDKEVAFVFGTNVLRESFPIQDHIEYLTMTLYDFLMDYKMNKSEDNVIQVMNSLSSMSSNLLEKHANECCVWEYLVLPETFLAKHKLKRNYGKQAHSVWMRILNETFGIQTPIFLTAAQIKILENYRKLST